MVVVVVVRRSLFVVVVVVVVERRTFEDSFGRHRQNERTKENNEQLR